MPKRVAAAGGIVWRRNNQGDIEIAGIYRPACDNWSLPKGKLDAEETPLAGAVREVEEETGLSPIPQTYLTQATYQLSNPDGDVTKVVDYWSMRARDPHVEFAPTDEVTKLRWFTLDEAETSLTRPRDQQALKVFRDLSEVTATVVLVRHASAESGSDDHARELDAAGRTRTAELATLLSLYEPSSIVTATIPRCVATVTPLAAAVSGTVREESVFDLDSHLEAPEAAAERLRKIASDGGGVVCSQLPVIADTLALIADIDGVPVPIVNTEPGQGWVLSFAGSHAVAIERL